MEHPCLPGIGVLEEAFSKIKALSEDDLKDSMKNYLASLENYYGPDYRPPRKWSPQIFKDKKPWFQMSAEAMQSVLMVEFLKHALGKRDAQYVVALGDKLK
jgi:hypothetical protein